MSYLLRHGAISESVNITPQGYITITDMVLWLNKKTDGQTPITKHHFERIVAMDKKARFGIRNNAICAVNGHSIELPDLTIPECNETARGHRQYLVHETYLKCLPGILKDGLSRMSRNNIHLSMETGRAGLQRKQKPNLVIYVDVTLAKRHGYHISPYFFHGIRNKNTGELISFPKRLPPVVEEENNNETDDGIELPPPAGATGFELTNNMKGKVQKKKSGATSSTNRLDAEPTNFQDRLLSIYVMDNDVLKERVYKNRLRMALFSCYKTRMCKRRVK